MDDRLILVKCVTLLYRESLIPEKTENSSDLVRTILEEIKLPEYNLSINHDRDLLSSLKDTALYMCANPVDYIYEKEELLQRLKVNCSTDIKIYEALEQGIKKDMDEGSLKRTILNIRKYINDVFRENEIVKIVKDASVSVNFNRDKIKSMRTFVSDLCSRLEPYQIEANRTDPAIVSSVDVGDTGSLSNVFNEIKEMADSSGLLVTGWQGLNEMLQGGIRPGEQIVLPALQHKYKTGFTLSLFKQLCIYNKPKLRDPKKKPCLIRISFEDSLANNLQFLYNNLHFNETGRLADIKNTSIGAMASYVREKLSVNGWSIKMLRVNASEWTYKDLHNYILELEAEGYEIHACIVDYLPMMPTTGCEEGPAGHSLRDLYRRTRNFFSARRIALITPHQLSTDAKQLIRDGRQDFVKLLPGMGYYAGSKQIDQEVDVEVFLHIEKFNNMSFLTLQRGKHRGLEALEETAKYMVLPFPKVGPIPDDLGKPAIHSRKLGGGPVGSGEETPFFMFDDSAK
jgi:hypothetical protein